MTFATRKAKRGAPTVCARKPVQTLAGAKTTQLSCDWKMPWGYIYLTAPARDNVTTFDVWAQTTRYAAVHAKEKAAEHQQLQTILAGHLPTTTPRPSPAGAFSFSGNGLPQEGPLGWCGPAQCPATRQRRIARHCIALKTASWVAVASFPAGGRPRSAKPVFLLLVHANSV